MSPKQFAVQGVETAGDDNADTGNALPVRYFAPDQVSDDAAKDDGQEFERCEHADRQVVLRDGKVLVDRPTRMTA